ncbi:hypothetical protein E4U30_004574 [Claviceps sp. LM220 group G6]|nr:hypothetical protein E4U30_004574 [Claviceps sp. LM220 group G6]
MDLRIRLRDDFKSWKEESFDLMSALVQKGLCQFLRGKRALFECGFRRKLALFLIEVVETEPPAETEWQRIRHSTYPSFPSHTQQARRSGSSIQQLLPKVIESKIPSKYEKKNLSVLREPLSTAGSYSKPEIAFVNKAVSDFANELLEARRTSLRVTTHDTPGGDEEEHPPDPPKSAAFRPCDEPEQCPNEALDKESPTDEEEPSNNKDSADVEESDGPIGDQRWRVKETFREEFATVAYQGSS